MRREMQNCDPAWFTRSEPLQAAQLIQQKSRPQSRKRRGTMEDDKIIALYWARKEEAISETDRKYGSYCRSISFRILNDKEDSEECVNDTWLHTWNAIPPGKPEFLAGFLGKIVRNLSISKYRAGHAQKRGSGETQALLDEDLMGR